MTDEIAPSWIETHTGRRFDFVSHLPFDVQDIAHALSNLCRYNGHVHTFYSVAEHCVLLTRWARSKGYSPQIQRAMLMHDAAEAYLGDVPSPLKGILPDFKAIERHIDAQVAKRFWFRYPFHDVVKFADLHVLVDERQQALYPTHNSWTTDGLAPLGVTLQFWQPAQAKAEFLLFTEDLKIK